VSYVDKDLSFDKRLLPSAAYQLIREVVSWWDSAYPTGYWLT